MKRVHFAPLTAALLAAITGTSGANVKHTIGTQRSTRVVELPIDVARVPAECRAFLAIPTDSTSELLPWQQKLSLAACRADVTVAPVTAPGQLGAVVATLDDAMAPSRTIYRDAIAHGPDRIRILAAYGLGMTYVEVIVRARDAIVADSGFGGSTYGGRYERSHAMHFALEHLLASDRDAALAAFDEAARVADADPAAARADQVTELAVANAWVEAEMLRE